MLLDNNTVTNLMQIQIRGCGKSNLNTLWNRQAKL